MPRSVTSAGDAIATALNSAKSSVEGFMSNGFEGCLSVVRLSCAVIVCLLVRLDESNEIYMQNWFGGCQPVAAENLVIRNIVRPVSFASSLIPSFTAF